MLFVTYYELNNELETGQILEAGNKLLEAGMWPPEGMDIKRWDTTAEGWGVTIAEADDYETIYRSIMMWDALVPGMFEEINVAPAAPVEESMAAGGQLLDEISELE